MTDQTTETPATVTSAGTEPLSDATTSPSAATERTTDHGANEGQQAEAATQTTPRGRPRLLVPEGCRCGGRGQCVWCLVDDLREEGDTLGLSMIAPALEATERELAATKAVS